MHTIIYIGTIFYKFLYFKNKILTYQYGFENDLIVSIFSHVEFIGQNADSILAIRYQCENSVWSIIHINNILALKKKPFV